MKFAIGTELAGAPDKARSGSPRLGSGMPPWWSFSGRWPCVTTPCQSIAVVNGSAPVTVGSVVYQSGSMIPITSYQDARRVS
jgi:hypothetical protein